MKGDKELLELAAKAAGYSIKAHEDGTLYSDCRCAGYWGVWNPLTDDGDALRLAVALKLDIMTRWGEAYSAALDREGNFTIQPDVDFDMPAATRRAIVRAAAGIEEARISAASAQSFFGKGAE